MEKINLSLRVFWRLSALVLLTHCHSQDMRFERGVSSQGLATSEAPVVDPAPPSPDPSKDSSKENPKEGPKNGSQGGQETSHPSPTASPLPAPDPSFSPSPPILMPTPNGTGTPIPSLIPPSPALDPTPTPPDPLPSPRPLTKAEKLAHIMARGCQVPNLSDPNEYTSIRGSGGSTPQYEDILHQLEACGDSSYPETPTTGEQKKSLQSMLDPQSHLVEKLFSSFWYVLPYVDHFELYFGLEIQEARHLFCYKDRGLSGILATREYTEKCLQAKSCSQWASDSKAVDRFNEVQRVRQQLIQCLAGGS